MRGAGAPFRLRCTDSRPVALDPSRPYKPLDLGDGIVAGSVSSGGRWLSLGLAHPVHGRVVLTDAAPFPEELRHDQQAVRRYRARLAAPDRAGFGLALLSGPGEAYLIEDGIPLAVHELPPARLEVPTVVSRGRAAAAHAVRPPSARVEV
ncbi:MAG: hypothetical protein M3O91_01020, partial [Chloroflexota bacterium]|nr:hypothetical protein [Chloroflexota bacterium]